MNKVAKTTKNEIASVDTNMFMADAETQSGLVNVSSTDDLALPFLKVLSQLSPQCNKTSNNYVEGSEPGMIYNTVSGSLYDGEQGIDIIPCHYKREFIEWGERGKGSGAPVAIHGADFDISQAPRDSNYQNRMANGNVIDETANHYVLVVSENGYEQALITMKATQRKVSRKWNSMMLGLKMQGKNGPFTPPSYSHTYKLRTVPQSNSKGTWFGWDIQKIGPVSDKGIYEAAKSFSQAVGKDTVKVSHEEEAQAATSNSY